MKTVDNIRFSINNDISLSAGVVFCKIDPTRMDNFSPYVILFNNGGIVYSFSRKECVWCMPGCLITSQYTVISVFYTTNHNIVDKVLCGEFTEEDEKREACIRLDSDDLDLPLKINEKIPNSTLNAMNKYGLV